MWNALQELSPQNLAGIAKAKTLLGGNMCRWDDSINVDLEV
jgi:hypothetical protein